MRYLNTYEAFDASALPHNLRNNNPAGDDIDNIKDICLDITDDGFGVSIYSMNKSPNIRHITIDKMVDGASIFDYKEIEEVVNRLNEYLGDKVISSKAVNAQVYKGKILMYEIIYNNIEVHNESWRHDNTTPIIDVKSDVEDILLDIADLGYVITVNTYEEEKWNKQQVPAISILIESTGYNYIDLDEISETFIRLYDYMKNNHQTFYKRNPDSAHISTPATQTHWKPVGWAQFDKRHPDAYNHLKSERIRKIKLIWLERQVP